MFRFFDSGHEEGYAHGRIHGLIEGRSLGNEKGFEMWEEIGFYEGFSIIWRSILEQQNRFDEYARPSCVFTRMTHGEFAAVVQCITFSTFLTLFHSSRVLTRK